MSYQPPVRSPLDVGALRRSAIPGNVDEALGEATRLIETELASRAVLLTDSGTSALRLALRSPGGNTPVVALPAFCCYDVATAADGAQADVLLYDLDPDTLGPDWASLRRALAGGATAVVAAHLYGIPVCLGEVSRLCAEHGALLIEDAAQGVGGTLDGKPLGSHGPLAVLSFGRGKGRTGGRGGALVANDERGRSLVAEAMPRLAPPRESAGDWLRLVGQWALGRPGWYRLPAALPFLALGETAYRAPHEPTGMGPRAARVLAATWPLQGAETAARRRNAELVARILGGRRGVAPLGLTHLADGGWLRLPARLEGAVPSREARPLGVWPAYPRTLADLPGFTARIRNAGDEFPGARRLAAGLYTFPTHGFMSADSLGRLERWMDTRWPR